MKDYWSSGHSGATGPIEGRGPRPAWRDQRPWFLEVSGNPIQMCHTILQQDGAMRRLLAVALLLIANSVSGQQARPLALGFDLGPALPIGEFADDGAELGWAANLSATLRITPTLGVSASYSRTTFGLDEAATSSGNDNWTDSGVGVGARLWYPKRDEQSRFRSWLQLGLGWHDLDPLIAGPEFSVIDTEGILTPEGSGGIEFVISPRLLLLGPTLRYRRYTFEVETATGALKSRISWLSVAVGFALTLAGSGR
ncbi:MAG: porin family protein [Gemmatimonadetes bacterium]|nr:porin family protein [Gemmatimonadota bacterium]